MKINNLHKLNFFYIFLYFFWVGQRTPHPVCYTLRMKIKNSNGQKNIIFTMSNGTKIHILETSVFRAHLKILNLNNRFGWNLEVTDINV